MSSHDRLITMDSLAEHSCSSFDLVVSYVHMRIFFLFPVMPTMGVHGSSKQMRVERLTRIRRLRAPMEVILF
jgi:hypothetical protein